MKRLALLALACLAIPGAFPQGQPLQAQGKKGRPVQKQAAINQATMLYRADLQRQQAAMAAALAQKARWQQAAWHAKSKQPSTVVVRTKTTITPANTGKKARVAQPVVLSTQVTSRMPKRGTASELVIRSTLKGPGGFVSRFNETQRITTSRGKYQYKDTWTQTVGSGRNAVKSRFTEQVTIRGGKEVIKEKWSIRASNPALAYLPLQVQMRQLANMLPHHHWHHHWHHHHPHWWYAHRPWEPWYKPLYLAASGKRTSIQTTIRYPGGAERINTRIVNKYDRAGRFLGVQVQVKDTVRGKATPALARLSPQAQIHLLEAVAGRPRFYPYAVYNPLAYSWANRYYRTNWMALERLAAAQGYPIW